MPYTEEHRSIGIGTVLGEDAFLLRRCRMREELGRPFRMQLELLSETQEIAFADIVGTNATVRFKLDDDNDRFFNGFVAAFEQVEIRDKLAVYRAELVPWLWFLSRSADCRIFQNMTVPDIIKEVFRDHGFSDFEERLTGSYRTWEYCVQYRETAFQFVSRLMEQEGIYYYFTHENGRHTLVMVDASSGHESFGDYAEVRFRPETGDDLGEECIREWHFRTRLMSGNYAVTDFDFKVPAKGLYVTEAISRSHAVADFEIYDYPGEYVEYAEGQAHARVRMEELQTPHQVARGRSDCRGIATGSVFSLTEHPRGDQCIEYLVTASVYELNEATSFYADAEGVKQEERCRCTFWAMPSSEQFRAASRTPKPLVQGPQTAIVVGPSGQEIWTDEYGRVKVQFHWDRESTADENSSCWIRVSQPWAGKKWGWMTIPRIGQEVIVEFLEGDPDRPIITGRVYNGQAMPPYTLPDAKTQSTWKSNSTPGGGGFNEIRFEDKAGEEQIFIHAQYDEDIRVLNDAREWIGANRHLIVVADQYEKVEGDKHYQVLGERIGAITGDDSLTVDGSQLVQVNTDVHRDVGGELVEKIGGDRGATVGMNDNLDVGLSYSLNAGLDIMVKAGLNIALESAMEAHLKGGVSAIVEGGLGATLKSGSSHVTVNSAGVFISGPLVSINSGGAALSGGGASPEAPASPSPPSTPVDPDEADDDTAGEVSTADPTQQQRPAAASTDSTQAACSAAQVLQEAAQTGAPFCEQCARAAAAAGGTQQ